MRKINSSKELLEYLTELATGGDVERRRQKSQVASTRASLRTKKSAGSDLDEAEGEDDEGISDEAGDKDDAEFSIDVPEPTKKEISDVSVADVTKAINLIRAGKSTKDKDIQAQLRAYLTKLSKSEQQTMYTFLLAIAELLVLGHPGDDAPKPDNLGINIKATVIPTTGQKRTETPAKQQSGTDDSPIVVGEVANKTQEKIVFERHR